MLLPKKKYYQTSWIIVWSRFRCASKRVPTITSKGVKLIVYGLKDMTTLLISTHAFSWELDLCSERGFRTHCESYEFIKMQVHKSLLRLGLLDDAMSASWKLNPKGPPEPLNRNYSFGHVPRYIFSSETWP